MRDKQPSFGQSTKRLGISKICNPRNAPVISSPYVINAAVPCRPCTSLAHGDSVVGFNIREAQRDTIIPTGGGPNGDLPVTILKGQHVAYSVIGLQRRPDIVSPDAGDWRPDRYFHWAPQTWEFIPFNHGPRICLGRVFGYFQMEYTLCRIFQHFERVELHEPRVQRIKVELNTKMAYPVNSSFHKAVY